MLALRGRWAVAGWLVLAGSCAHKGGAGEVSGGEVAGGEVAEDDGVAGEVAAAGEAPPVVDTLMEPGWEPGPPRWQADAKDPRFVRRVDGGPELGFVEQPCALGSHCGCKVATEHHYRRTETGWRVVVVVPKVVIRKIVERGTCGEGCGQQVPPDPQPIRSLGAVAPEDVEIVVRHPRKIVWERTCTDPMPMP